MAATPRSLTRGRAASLCLASLLLAGGCLAAEDYEGWVHRLSRGDDWGLITNKSTAGQRLVITAVLGDDEPARRDSFPTEYTSGTQVTKQGEVWSFTHTAMGSKGGGGETLAAAVLSKLDELLLQLPEDGKRLPPKGRRVLVYGTVGEKPVIRVYDRANAPEPFWEVVRLVGAHVTAYVPKFAPSSEIDARGFEHEGFCALSPDGRALLYTGLNQPLQIWSPASHELLAEVRGLGSRSVAFSPDGRQAVVAGSSESYFLDTATWKAGRKLPGYRDPHYLPDGRHVLLSTTEKPLQIFESSTGKRVAHLAGIPEEAVKYLPAAQGHRAIVQLAQGRVVLWNSTERREIATLSEDAELTDAAFSPDESLVVVSTRDVPQSRRATRCNLWRADTGALMHELHPFEQMSREPMAGLLWTPDGEYVLAGGSSGFDSPNTICVFNANTGRHRGQFRADSLYQLNGIALLPDASELIAGSGNGKVCFWDFPAALRDIRAFEKSLTHP